MTKMIYLVVLLISLSVFSNEQNLRLELVPVEGRAFLLDFDNRGNAQKDKIFPVSFMLVLHNQGNVRLVFYKESNGWGYKNIQFKWWDNEREHMEKIEKKQQSWSRNIPEYFSIPPKSSISIPVSFALGVWDYRTAMSLGRFRSGFIQAVYRQVLQFNEAKETTLGINWEGEVSSPVYPVEQIWQQIIPPLKFTREPLPEKGENL